MTVRNGHAVDGILSKAFAAAKSRGVVSAPRARVAEYVPFPVDHLPNTLRQMVVEVAEAVGCDPAYAAMPALTLAGSAIGGALVVSPKRGWQEPPTLYTAIVADSGTAKSPAASPFLKIANLIEDELEEEHRAARDLAQSNTEPDTKPKVPPREYYLASDLTAERLVENLSTSPRGVHVHRDELVAFFSGLTRYRSSGSDAPVYLSAFEAGTVAYQRRTGSPRDVRVRRGVVSISGGVQPGILQEILKDRSFIASGLAARFLFALPPKRCPRWSEVEVDPNTESRFTTVIRYLRGIPFDPLTGPGRVGMLLEARSLWTAFVDEMATRAEDMDGGPLDAALQKLGRYALRLALIHHGVSCAAKDVDPGAKQLGIASMAAGVDLARWFAHEADRVYDVVAERAEDTDTRRLVELIRRKGGQTTVRGLVTNNTKRYPTADCATAALDVLESEGLGEWRTVSPGRSGGRPTRVFLLKGQQNSKTETP